MVKGWGFIIPSDGKLTREMAEKIYKESISLARSKRMYGTVRVKVEPHIGIRHKGQIYYWVGMYRGDKSAQDSLAKLWKKFGFDVVTQESDPLYRLFYVRRGG